MSVNTLKERAKWAINYIVRKEHLSNIKLGRQMGFAAGTINSYRRMTTDPSIEFLFWSFVSCLNLMFYGLFWEKVILFSGRAKHFLNQKALIRYHHCLRTISDDQRFTLREPKTDYGAQAAEQKISIEEAVGKAFKILSSGTTLSNALYLIIQQFAIALDGSQGTQSLPGWNQRAKSANAWIARTGGSPRWHPFNSQRANRVLRTTK